MNPAGKNSPSQLQVQAPPRRKALEILAATMNLDGARLLETLKATVFKDAKTEEELVALVVVANQYGLNPFLNEIYAFPGKRGGIVPIVGVDGWNKMMQRQESFNGIEFNFDHVEPEPGKKMVPISCTATVFIKGREHPVKVTEFYDECFRPTEPWKNMPFRMLRHKALIQVARLAFGFSGLYDEDEGREAAINVSAEVVPASPKFLTGGPAVQPRAEPPKPAPAPAPAEQNSPPIEADQRTPFEKMKDKGKAGNVTEDQMHAWAKENKLAGAKTTGIDEMTEANVIKMLEQWDNILPLIREIQI